MSEQQVDVRTDIPFQDEAGSTAKEFRRGLKDGLPVLLGVVPLLWCWALRQAKRDSIVWKSR